MNNKFFLTLMLALVITMGASCSLSSGSTTSGPAGVFVSTDNGDNWKAVSVMPTTEGNKSLTGVSVYRLVADPQDPNALYWASRESGLFYSYDGGSSWQHAKGALAKGFVYALAVHPKDRCTLFASNGRQVLKTIDCSRNWDESFYEVDAKVSIKSVAIDPEDPAVVLVGGSNGQLLRSVDGGISWNKIKKFSSSLLTIEFDRNKSGLIYIATQNKGLYRSFDGGETWTGLASKLKEYPGALTFRRLYVYPTVSDHVYWISKYGILVSKNAGNDWDPLTLVNQPGSINIYGFGIDPEDENKIYYTGISGTFSNFYRSSDGGKNWETKGMPSKQLPMVLFIHPKDRIYLGMTIPTKK